MLVSKRFVVSGRVQGVGFRAWAQHEAARLGLAGWAANLPDGSVEVVIHGREADIAALRARLHQGPRFARVLAVRETALDAAARTAAQSRATFEVR